MAYFKVISAARLARVHPEGQKSFGPDGGLEGATAWPMPGELATGCVGR